MESANTSVWLVSWVAERMSGVSEWVLVDEFVGVYVRQSVQHLLNPFWFTVTKLSNY